jgi:hypothetical protein
MHDDMIWYANMGRPKIAGQIKYFNDKSNLVSKSVFGQKLPQFDLFFENNCFSSLGSNFWRKKIESQEIIPESTSEDRRAALLRRKVVCLRVGACVREVGINLVICEWIQVSYITYY